MALFKSLTALGVKPVVDVNDALPVDIPYEYETTGALAAGDIIWLGPLQPGLRPLDVSLVTDDQDTGGSPSITLSVGFLNAGMTDLDGTAFIVASTVGQTGGVARATTATCFLAGSSTSERQIGIKVVAGPATSAGAGKKMVVLLTVAG